MQEKIKYEIKEVNQRNKKSNDFHSSSFIDSFEYC